MQLTIGDHLVTDRTMYDHHGIYIGDSKVVHYSGLANGLSKGDIQITSLKNFAAGKGIKILKTKTSFTEYEIAERAIRRVGEDDYNLVFNNCEHFANWCRTGKSSSAQVQKVVSLSTDALAIYVNWPISAAANPLVHTALRTGALGLASPATTSFAPAIAKAMTYAAPASGLVGTIAGSSVGGGTAAALLSTSAAVTTGLVAAPLTAVVAPVAIAVGTGVAIKAVFDWIWD